jgi:hypothetical protein
MYLFSPNPHQCEQDKEQKALHSPRLHISIMYSKNVGPKRTEKGGFFLTEQVNLTV